MKYVGLLFSAPMVQAILNTKPNTWPSRAYDPSNPFKSQTRRVEKARGGARYKEVFLVDSWSDGIFPAVIHNGVETRLRPPYGPGDVIYVKETWTDRDNTGDLIEPIFRADNLEYKDGDGFGWEPKWKSSMFMPQARAWILLEVRSVRWERLQDISEEDAVEEGILEDPDCIVGASGAGGFHHEITGTRYFYKGGDDEGYEDGRGAYRALWEKLNGPGSWDKNPVVRVTEFMRIK